MMWNVILGISNLLTVSPKVNDMTTMFCSHETLPFGHSRCFCTVEHARQQRWWWWCPIFGGAINNLLT